MIWLGAAVLALLFGLCTVFGSVVTVAQAWQEHFQARWPQVTATVEKCAMTRTSTAQRQKFYIRCRVNYAVGDHQYARNLYSRTVPSPEVWQYPPNQMAPFEQWANDHPQGTPIVVRYDPADPSKIVLVAPYMPGGGPHTPDNVKLLGFFAAGFLLLFTITRFTRPQSLPQG
jgi:hypothetical protein